MADEDDEVERMLSVATVAGLLETGTDYVYDRIKSGEFTAILELGESRPKQRIPLSSYKAFIKSRTFGNKAA